MRSQVHAPFGTSDNSLSTDHDAVNVHYDTADDHLKYKLRSSPTTVHQLVTDLNAVQEVRYEYIADTQIGSINNWNVGADHTAFVSVATTGSVITTGLVAGQTGQYVLFHSPTSYFSCSHQNTSSSAANRYITLGALNITTNECASDGWIAMIYANSRWNIVGVGAGVIIGSSFSAASFTANGGGTWTVESADRIWCSRIEWGNQNYDYMIDINNTSIAGTVTSLNILSSGNGLGASNNPDRTIEGPCIINENGTRTRGIVKFTTDATTIEIRKMDGTNFAAATNTTSIHAHCAVPLAYQATVA